MTPSAAALLPDAAAIERTAGAFREFQVRAERFGLPLCGALCPRIALDADVLRIAAHVPAGQPVAALFIAVVFYRLLEQPQQPLARFFPAITPDPAPFDAAWPVFRAFCLQHAGELADLLRGRTLQTTTAERGAYVLLALDHVARQVGQPLSLIEIGCSAGLCLLFDEYGYDFGAGGGLSRDDTTLTIRPRFRGTPPPAPARYPAIRSRIGIDLQPLDPMDERERRWIRAMLFPEWTAEHRLLDAALKVRARHPLAVLQADALQVLPTLIEATPGPLCIFHSLCLYQWPVAVQQQLEAQLLHHSRGRMLHRISIEMGGLGFDLETIAKALRAGQALEVKIEHLVYQDGARVGTQVLGETDAFARWIDWRG